MPNNPCIPLYKDGDDLTGYCTAAVVGKTFIDVDSTTTGFQSGPPLTTTAVPAAWDGGNVQVKTCAAGGKPLGVAAYDAAIGTIVPIFRGHSVVVPVTAGAAVTAGQEVQSDASGNAIPLAAGKSAGKALNSAASGADVFVAVYA